jgi:pyruvate/2-oxoacid:ferredoxin oxidoreductase beta subunit
MGFRKPNLEQARNLIGASLIEISSPYNDGWTSSSCKQELYQLKCWLEDKYSKLPSFAEEELWEQERLIQLLKQE